MQMKKIVLVGIMTVIMLSGCGKTVQNSAMREETTQETRNTEQESVTEKDISMNEKESLNAESNINDVINLWNSLLWRKRLPCTGCGDYAVHRSFSGDRNGAANLCLCRNK